MNFGSGRVPPGPRFRRAIATGNLFLAELAVREMRDPLPLNDALDLVFVIAEQEPDPLVRGKLTPSVHPRRHVASAY